MKYPLPWFRALHLAFLMVGAGLAAPVHAVIDIAQLRCESYPAPLGIDSPHPRLSWTVESAQRNQRQTAYRILVAPTETALAGERNDALCWDSGKVSASETLEIAYAGKPLASGQRYFWKVKVWDQDDQASSWSPGTFWEMGLLQPSDWTGQWMNDGKANPARDEDFYLDDPAPLFRREFALAKPVRRARLYVTGLGYYEASLNGQRVGDHLLDPGWTAFDKQVFYSTYDVTGQLAAGANCLGVTLGNGWWNLQPLRLGGRYNLRAPLPSGRPRFIAQLNIEFEDGSTQTVVSDGTWKVTAGPIQFNSIYLGEVYDARKELPGWDRAGFNDQAWRPAKPVEERIGRLEAQPQPPIRIFARLDAVKVTEPQPGVFIYDLGQNFGGWATLRLQAPAGTKIVLRYGELLHKNGTLNPMTSVAGQIKGRRKNAAGVEANIGGPGSPLIAWQTDTYITKGSGIESYTPRFTFHGFRYLEVTGLSRALPLTDVNGLRLSADVTDAGTFSSSNTLLNQIQEMCLRTFKSNLFSVQSDCPHRERLAWSGDIIASSEAFILNYDMANFYPKTTKDFADTAVDGIIADTAPYIGLRAFGIGWASVHPVLVSHLYRYYGNRRLVEEQYETAKNWVLSASALYPEGIVTKGLSDHESLAPKPEGPLLTPLFYQGTRVVIEMARILGRKDDVVQLEAIASRTREAYIMQFFDPVSGKVGPGNQSTQAFALYTDLVPESGCSRAVGHLLADIRQTHKGHLSTGILGTRYLLEELSSAGHADVVYGIVTQRDFPGWGWMLHNGATTLWEHWEQSDNIYSHNHPMFGSVSQWFINWLGGIQPAPEAVGFDRLIIQPQTVPDLQWVKSSYRSVRGLIVSNWRREVDGLYFEITVPANTTATLHLPALPSATLTEAGNPAALAGVVRTATTATVAVGSGQYHFVVRK